MNYQRIVLVGNVTNDAERKTSGNVEYTIFGLGVADAKNRPTYFRVATFSKVGKAVAQHVTKGREVLVEGRIEVNKNGSFGVVADRVVFGAQPNSRAQTSSGRTKEEVKRTEPGIRQASPAR